MLKLGHISLHSTAENGIDEDDIKTSLYEWNAQIEVLRPASVSTSVSEGIVTLPQIELT